MSVGTGVAVIVGVGVGVCVGAPVGVTVGVAVGVGVGAFTLTDTLIGTPATNAADEDCIIV